MPIESIVPYVRNPRKNEAAVAKVASSLREYGWRQPIVVDEALTVIAGHTRLMAARSLGMATVPVHVAKGLTKAQAKAYRIGDNRTAQESEWDNDLLALEFADLAGEGFDLSLTGFDADELAALMAPASGVLDGADLDDAPPLPVNPITTPGDLIILGRHRLLCGDSTRSADVARLMERKLAGLVFTDPPYGVDYDGGMVVREKLAGDTTTALYGPACSMAAEYSEKDAALYLWHAGVKGIPAAPAAAAAAAAAAAGYEIRCELVWNKNLAQFGALSAQYKQKHEPCYYCFKKGHAPRWFGPTNEVTVWDCDRASANKYHPTQKPVALAQRAFENSSRVNDIVLDLFGGSGSTLMAAEATGRAARLLEIDPRYCDVIVSRWETATGQKAERPRLVA